MKKILLIVLLSLTGCTVKYEIDITKDLSVTETITALEPESFFAPYYNSSKERIVKKIYETSVGNLDLDYRYSYKEEENDTNYYGMEVEKEFHSLNDYIDDEIVSSQYWDSLDYQKEGDFVTIKSKGEFYGYVTQDPNKFIIDDLQIIIRMPFDVIDSNGDCSEVNNNTTCIWLIDKNTEDMKIFLKFNTVIKENLTNRQKIEKEISNIIKSKKFKITIVAIVSLALIVLGGIFLNKFRKRNQI